MNKLIGITLIFLGLANVAISKETETRTLSYSQWFDEMVACQGSTYFLSNAIITPNLTSDTISRPTMTVSAQVLIRGVEFKGYSLDDMTHLKHWENNSATFKNFRFLNDMVLENCTGVFPTIFGSEFHGNVEFRNITSNHNLTIRSNTFKKGLFLSDISCNSILLYSDSIYGPLHLQNISGDNITVANSHIKIQNPDLQKQEFPLILRDCNLNNFTSYNNTILQTAPDQIVLFHTNNIANGLSIFKSQISPFTLLAHQKVERLILGIEMVWERGVGLFAIQHNEFSFFNWSALKGKVFAYNYEIHRKGQIMEIYKGESDAELDNRLDFDRLILAKQSIRNTFIYQGLREYANEVLIEIRDLETRMWKHKYKNEKTLEAYFHWKMNMFLKKFAAYGTNPVIAIIYSLKVILLFGLIYLFFHNDWGIGSRKKIGKRLRFILTYFQVNKGLLELDQEQQLESQDEVALLQSKNEDSKGKIPQFFTRVIRWYIQSNLISNNLRKRALKKMDILSGTFSKLTKQQQRKVAFLSGAWFIGFLIYTLLQKVLNALTLSLNAFTTLGFGNIPTKGFSRYIVIVQGFIGWVLMTIFSVTLITQLIQ